MATWVLSAPRKFAEPAALSDLRPLLERLLVALGNNRLGEALGVGRSTVSNWRSGRRPISDQHAQRLLDLHDVLTRALQFMDPTVLPDWLDGNEPFLDGARPIDVLAARGAGPLIEALRSIATGAAA